MNKYDLLVPITSRDMYVLNKMGNKKSAHVAMTGIDFHNLIIDNSNTNYPSLFFIGALDWAPNQEGLNWFIKNLWPRIHTKFPDLIFKIAGRNAPEKIIANFNKPNIEYIGAVDNAYQFMNQNAIMIAPLFSGSGMRIKIIEGMSLGKVIITTTIGSEGIDTNHNENILIADTEMDFIKSIEQLVTDQNLFNKISNNAIKFIENNFNNNNITAELVDFYKFQINNLV